MGKLFSADFISRRRVFRRTEAPKSKNSVTFFLQDPSGHADPCLTGSEENTKPKASSLRMTEKNYFCSFFITLQTWLVRTVQPSSWQRSSVKRRQKNTSGYFHSLFNCVWSLRHLIKSQLLISLRANVYESSTL